MSAIIDTLIATLQAAPHSWQARQALVEALVAEERFEEAHSVLSQVTELPEDMESLLMAARAYAAIDPSSGIEILDQIIAADPTNAEALFNKAVFCYNAGDIETAQRQYTAATTFDPSLANAEIESQLFPETTDSEAIEEAPQPLKNPVESAPRDDVYYPSPGEYPTMTLAEALAMPKPVPLVPPDSIPESPHIAYQKEVDYVPTVHTERDQFLSQAHNVEIHSAHYQEPVSYSYVEPDDSMFDPTVTPEDIYVGALCTETGEPVASLQESIRRNKEIKELERKRKESAAKIQSVVIACITMVLVCLAMWSVVTSMPRPPAPQIIASAVAPSPENLLEKPTIVKSTPTPTPSSSSSSSMDIMTVASASNISMMSFDSPTVDLGSSMLGGDFGSSMSFGDTGGGGSVMFFGGKSSGKRFLFVLDASASMQANQIKLRDDELEKTLKSLRNVDYHVLLFAGGAYFADEDWGLDPKGPKGSGGPTHFLSPDGPYQFTNKGLFDFTLLEEKKFKTPDWKRATPSSIRRSIKFVRESKKFSGTDWDNALKMGHLMDPPPDVIFFMSDGADNKLDADEILRNSRKYGRPKINCVAMQTATGKEKFAEIAEKSRGTFTIVDKDGEPIDGFEFIKDPDKFKGRL